MTEKRSNITALLRNKAFNRGLPMRKQFIPRGIYTFFDRYFVKGG